MGQEKKAAKDAKPFTQTNENLAVTVHTTTNYNYLYFPDDGSNTKRHYGDQQFMIKGGENKQQQIIDLIVDNLVSNIEGD